MCCMGLVCRVGQARHGLRQPDGCRAYNADAAAFDKFYKEMVLLQSSHSRLPRWARARRIRRQPGGDPAGSALGRCRGPEYNTNGRGDPLLGLGMERSGPQHT